MPENLPSPAPSGPLAEWLTNGKIPGAAKAIAHLIGSTADAGAAWINIATVKGQQIQQNIKDDTSASTVLSQALAQAAAQQGIEDAGLVKRAIDQWAGDRLKKQTNRESIAQKTAEYLSAGDPIDPETKAPDEEWLNLFGEYAEKASTDKLRNMWARVLAGEIRKPGVFSYRTIQFVSTLDAKVAQTLEEIAPLICNSDMILYPKRFDFTDNFRKFQLLIECGLVGTPIVRRVTLAEDFQIFMVFGNTAGILATCSSNLPYDLPYAPLTTIGREIYELLQPVTSIEDLRLIGIELHGSGKFKNVQLQILNVESSGAIQIKSQETVV